MDRKNRLSVHQIAGKLYRRQAPRATALLLRSLMVNALAVLTFVAGLFLLFSKFEDRQHQAVVDLAPTRWKILVATGDQGCWQENKFSTCPASIQNTALWTSPLHRWDKDYFKWLTSDLTSPYWMGLEITAEELKRAQAAGATRLLLGLLFSRYEVWLEGKRIQTGDYLENDLPIAVDLPLDRMGTDQSLHVAILVRRDGKMETIDSQWIVPKMGLFTSKAADQQMRWRVFAGDTRFLILFSIFFLFGLIFRFASTTDETKIEFRAAASLAFILACSQFIMADSVFRLFGAHYYYLVLNAVLISEVLAALAFGLAISRSRTEWISLLNMVLPPAILFSFFLTPDTWVSGRLTTWILTFLTPTAYFVAGILCFIQYLHLQSYREGPQVSSQRNVMLALMSFIFLAVSLAFAAESRQALAVETHWARTLMVLPLLMLTTAIAEEVKRNFSLIESIPVSMYHQLSPLPEVVSGIVLNLDLKNSETLFRAGAENAVGGTIVSTLISQIWAKFQASGAVVLQTSGDDVLVLYPETKLKTNPAVWFETLRLIHDDLQTAARQLADREVELATLDKIEFRVAVALGAVRPLWRFVGKSKIPAWTEAGNSNVFVETARWLEIEKQWALERQLTQEAESTQQRGSVVIFDDAFRSLLEGLGPLGSHPINGIAKNKKSYQGSAIFITGSDRTSVHRAG